MNIRILNLKLLFFWIILLGCHSQPTEIINFEQKLKIAFPSAKVSATFNEIEINENKIHKVAHFGVSGKEHSLEHLEAYFYNVNKDLFELGKSLQLNQATISFYSPNGASNDLVFDCTLHEYQKLNFCNLQLGHAPNVEVIKQVSFN